MRETIKALLVIAIIQLGFISLVFITDKGAAKFSKAPVVSTESIDSFFEQEKLIHFE